MTRLRRGIYRGKVALPPAPVHHSSFITHHSSFITLRVPRGPLGTHPGPKMDVVWTGFFITFLPHTQRNPSPINPFSKTTSRAKNLLRRHRAQHPLLPFVPVRVIRGSLSPLRGFTKRTHPQKPSHQQVSSKCQRTTDKRSMTMPTISPHDSSLSSIPLAPPSRNSIQSPPPLPRTVGRLKRVTNILARDIGPQPGAT